MLFLTSSRTQTHACTLSDDATYAPAHGALGARVINSVIEAVMTALQADWLSAWNLPCCAVLDSAKGLWAIVEDFVKFLNDQKGQKSLEMTIGSANRQYIDPYMPVVYLVHQDDHVRWFVFIFTSFSHSDVSDQGVVLEVTTSFQSQMQILGNGHLWSWNTRLVWKSRKL